MMKRLEEKYRDSVVWQFIKFNLVALSISLLQLILANALPLFFDRLRIGLPSFLGAVFDPDIFFEGESPYVVNGAVTWGYILPLFLSNLIANIYGYFVNMRVTFKGHGTRKGALIYLVTLVILIIVSTWLQGIIIAHLSKGALAPVSRTIAAMAAGLFQVAVLFPLEKYVLFKERQ